MVFVLALSVLPVTVTFAWASEQPKLVLQITVDALRGDLPSRFSHVLSDGGFRYLMGRGIHYTDAHYQHSNTETIAGHTSLATGTVPAAHGMVANVWFGRLKSLRICLYADVFAKRRVKSRASTPGWISLLRLSKSCLPCPGFSGEHHFPEN